MRNMSHAKHSHSVSSSIAYTQINSTEKRGEKTVLLSDIDQRERETASFFFRWDIKMPRQIAQKHEEERQLIVAIASRDGIIGGSF